ncbi:MAG: glutamine-hydrolyzing GMP synthase [Gammaproteobacteria bacterium]|nr:glutamine-hydrolyzing GMP synthase [Gammaproteobacteria bacterium]
MASDSSRILILDYGSQYTQLIARRVREAGVYSEIHSHDIPAKTIASFGADGIILSGGPESVAADDAPGVSDAVISAGVPLLGICYGMQALATKLGGEVRGSDHREFGYAEVSLIVDNPLLGDITSEDKKLKVWMSHGDRVEALPDGFKQIASSNNAPIAGMADVQNQIYGVQFHPEVTHTENGQLIIERFVHEICGCPGHWTPKNIINEHIERVRDKVGTEHVLLGLSGGVDSSVVAALLHAAIGDQLICVFVDNGLLRLNEGDQVMETFAEHLGVNVIRVNAEDKFLSALDGEEDPEKKRKIIGRNFIEVFEEQANILNDIQWLAQGTIYPDVIESAGASTGKAHVIKSHHNVGGLPETMHLKLIEPLRDLFKDEVRKIGVELGLSDQLVDRHPFPGPGLGVRILGSVKKEYADLLRRADDIFISELREQGLYDKVSQAFAVFLPVKSVGVMGDGRRYDYVIALRAVETVDFMTARWAHLPYDFLDHVSRRIINEIEGISRVTYDISGKPPATIEWE